MFPAINPSYYYIIVVIQIACILHALKTGRRDWLYLLIFLPMIGAVIYFIREILPNFRTDNVARDIQHTFIPNSRIKELERNLAIADTDTNRLNLAAEYARQKQYGRAIELVKECMTGMYAQDPGMMLELARLYFHNEQPAESIKLFDRVMKEKNNRLDKSEDELLYARAQDAAGHKEPAEEEYKKVIRIHHSMEGRYFYGMMLKSQGRTQEAAEQFQIIQKEKNLHPQYVRRLNAE
jgi:hypothetical protein